IKDTGIGCSEEFQKNLFKPFMQECMGLDRKYEGTGLGLSIAKRLIDLIYASIEVSSVKGQGRTFRLIIPSKA
ncbi:ATP-binding protein, partial [Penaeicola halotolerans]|uniref:ATP-binding protein n=1 Tax=Penaeicola halotolerans TaxID=2793196 RepID=UPI0021D1A53D